MLKSQKRNVKISVIFLNFHFCAILCSDGDVNAAKRRSKTIRKAFPTTFP